MHHRTVITWVKCVGQLLPDAYEPEMVHPSLLRSAVCFSHIQQQWKCIIDNELEASAIAQIRFLTKREVVQLQGKGVYVVGVTGIRC